MDRPPPSAALARNSSQAGPLQATAELVSPSWPVRPPCGARPAVSAGRSRAKGVWPQNTETRTHSPSSCPLQLLQLLEGLLGFGLGTLGGLNGRRKLGCLRF